MGDSCDSYSKKQRRALKLIYIAAAVIWILLLYILNTFQTKQPYFYVLLGLPLFVYAIGFLSLNKSSRDVEERMFSGDFLTLSLLFVAVLIQATDGSHHYYTMYIILAAFVLIVLSTIDIWTTKKNLSIVLHVKSIMQTAAAVLLIYVLVIHFVSKIPLNQTVNTNSNTNNIIAVSST